MNATPRMYTNILNIYLYALRRKAIIGLLHVYVYEIHVHVTKVVP